MNLFFTKHVQYTGNDQWNKILTTQTHHQPRNLSRRMVWHTVTKAALMSNKTKMLQAPVSEEVRKSFVTQTKMVLVLFSDLNPDWNISKRLFVDIICSNWPTIQQRGPKLDSCSPIVRNKIKTFSILIF